MDGNKPFSFFKTDIFKTPLPCRGVSHPKKEIAKVKLFYNISLGIINPKFTRRTSSL